MKLNTKVTPWLGYNSQAEEAAAFYVATIPESRHIRTVRNPASDAAMVVEFELGGLPIYALNAGQDWGFSPSFSLSVSCDSQDEIDRLWSALSEGGQEFQCGWLADRFGLSWQIVPARLSEWMRGAEPERAGRVMAALCAMTKLDVAALQTAYERK